MPEIQPPSVLVVEDEVASLRLLAGYLEQEGYEVHTATNSSDAENILNEKSIDVVLLDIRIPGKDGLALTRDIRSSSNVGVILVTQKRDDIDKIVGLEMGADDYITKPYNPRELLVRLRNLLVRLKAASTVDSSQINDSKEAKFEDWSLHLGRRTLTHQEGATSQLTEGEFKLLSVLLQNAGSVMNRDQIMNRMERRDWFPNDRTIDVLVARLRRKLGDERKKPRFIDTARGTGYIFIADVQWH